VVALVNGLNDLSKLLPVLFYVSNFPNQISVAPELTQTWSLSVEVHFYLLWPIAFFCLLRWRDMKSAVWATAAAYVLFSAWRFVIWIHDQNVGHLYDATDARADELLVGCLAAMLTHVRVSAYAVNAAFVALILICVFLPNDGTLWILELGGPVVSILTAVLLAGITQQSFVGRFFSVPLMRHFGQISYGWYLWHLPIITWFSPNGTFLNLNPLLTFLILGTFSWILAVLSYQFLERRFTGSPSLFLRRRDAAPELITSLMPNSQGSATSQS